MLSSWFRRSDDAPASVTPATPSNDALAAAHLTLESALKAQAHELAQAADALNTAAGALLKAGKGSDASKAKKAALSARQSAERWL